MDKLYYIFAGVNGAGKSTMYASCHITDIPEIRVNSDEILRKQSGNWRNIQDQFKAMREAAGRVKDYLEQGVSFNQETTLSGSSIFNNIRKAKENGYIVNLYYIGVDSPDTAIERINQRVEKGGHGIPEEDVRDILDSPSHKHYSFAKEVGFYLKKQEPEKLLDGRRHE